MTVLSTARTIIFVSFSLIGASAAAQADARAFVALDGDGDGRISRGEALSAQADAYNRADRDSDGGIALDEIDTLRGISLPEDARPALVEHHEKRRRRWLARLDRDGDGSLGLGEYQQAMTPYFDAIDGDASGAIDREEFERAQAAPARPE